MAEENLSVEGLYSGMEALADAIERISAPMEELLSSMIEVCKAYGKFALWVETVNQMSDAQIVFTDDLTLEMAHKFQEKSTIELAVEEYYYEDGNIYSLIERIKRNKKMALYFSFYGEIMEAFKKEHYQLACAGLFTLADGILSDVTKMDTTNYKERIKEIEKNSDSLLIESTRKLICIYEGIKTVSTSMFKSVNFSREENNSLNRNRLQHGRTHRAYTRMDFLKALLLLDGILFLAEQGPVDNQIEVNKE